MSQKKAARHVGTTPVFAVTVEVMDVSHPCHICAGEAQISALTQTHGRKNYIRTRTKESGVREASWTLSCTATPCLPRSNIFCSTQIGVLLFLDRGLFIL